MTDPLRGAREELCNTARLYHDSDGHHAYSFRTRNRRRHESTDLPRRVRSECIHSLGGSRARRGDWG